jgi:FADH2 O2-dependent halogenase
MIPMRTSFDVIVLGSGIAGSMLALVLQRAGIKTLCVERKTHPRFVIGESTVPTTSILLKQLAHDYDIPELAEVAHYLGLRKNRCAAWPKQGFWHGIHREGERLETHQEHFLETFLLPLGPDVHMLRAGADAFLVSLFPKYEVEYEDNTEVLSCETNASGVKLRLLGARGEHSVEARFLVDATGHASFLARSLALRDDEPRLATNTRSIFSHFTGVPPVDELYGGCNPAFRFRRDGATMHHSFRGGWIWVIPFDSGVTSVGLELDRRLYPLDERIRPEDEFASVLERYPSIAAHLGGMTPIRPLIRTDRIQFTSRTILGDGFILAPHAAAFIEPLYSTGILLTALFISRFARAAGEAHAAGDWQKERFRPIEQSFFAEVEQIDHVVDGSIQSFRNNELFKQYWRNWTIGTVAHLTSCVLAGRAPQGPVFWGAGIREFRAHLARMHAAILASHTEDDDLALAARIHDETEPWWRLVAEPLMSSNDFAVGAGHGTCVYGTRRVDLSVEWLQKFCSLPETAMPELVYENGAKWLSRAAATYTEQLKQYRCSKLEGSDYHVAYEKVLAQNNLARFDYRKEMGL